MSQQSEREDPRQVPPKKFADNKTESGQPDSTGPAAGDDTGGLRDSESDARGAFDDGRAEGATDADQKGGSSSEDVTTPGSDPTRSGDSGSVGG